MRPTQNNYAFIDSQNLNLAIIEQGWFLSFQKFRIYLKEKYSVGHAYVFIGYLVGNTKLYQSLQEAGFICVFKPALTYKDGSIKGNCDAELVLHAMIDYNHYDKAVIVSGDGDFYCLVKYLIDNSKLSVLLIPNRFKFSALLRFKEIRPYLRFMNDLREKLSYKRKDPARTKP
ncbi:MAG: NYN domain-containing protein [Patescibacteria group bacterium]